MKKALFLTAAILSLISGASFAKEGILVQQITGKAPAPKVARKAFPRTQRYILALNAPTPHFDVIPNPPQEVAGSGSGSADPNAVMKAGVDQAYAILGAAEAQATDDWKPILHNVTSAFSGAQVYWPSKGNDFANCSGGAVGFVIEKSNIIYLCANTAYGSIPANWVPQVFIHEAAHVDGFYNECEASTVEVEAMNASGVGLAFRNVYMDGCGL